MGRISSGVGLVSGINSADIIEQLMSLEARPKQQLQTRIDQTNEKKLAYTDLSTRLTALRLTATKLKKPSTFEAASTSSSDENVLTASASNGAAIGSFQFQVARLVTSQQSVTGGFVDFDSAKVGAGSLTLELGGGELTSQTLLSQMRGGDGVRRGKFRLTDRSGATTVIDTTAAVTIDDVVKKINTSVDVSVRASLSGDQIVLTDLTGQTSSNLIAQDLGEGHAAADLGIAQSVGANTITGSDVNFVGRSTTLAELNDGRGVRTAASGADFRVTVGDGTTFDITVTPNKTIGGLIDAINLAGTTKLRAETVAGGNGIRLVDTSGGGGAFAVTALNSSAAATDLGILKTGALGTINGDPVIAGLNTVLISSLRGGTGLNLGTVSITDRNGASQTVDLSGARTVQDILNTISNAGGIGVTASLNASKNGIQITDDTGGTGNIVIADVSSTTAAELGIVGTFDTNTPIVKGANLQRQWVSQNTLLRDYNGGKGVASGKFTITNSTGTSATIDLTQGDEIRLADVIAEINAKGLGVTASINASGDGLLLTDSTGGALKMKVEDLDGTTAKDLNILGEATTNTIDGSFEKTLTLDATDTLTTVQQKLNELNWGVTASIINDGSGLAPYRLSLNAKSSGRGGRVVFDAGATLLKANTLVEAQDAAVFLGSADTEQPLLVTASKNQLSGVIKGVTIELHGVSDKPVTLGVTRSVDALVEDFTNFTEKFNELTAKLKDLTKFDVETNERGLLLGESAAQSIETEVYAMMQSVVNGAGQYRILSQVGVRVGAGAQLEFDEDKFRASYATDPDSVKSLFVLAEKGAATLIEGKINKLIDPVSGVITRQNKTLDDRTTQFQDRIETLDKLLLSKRGRLERQFAQLETVLAGLQSQQQALGAIQTITPQSRSR